jgi:adenylate cyclase
MRKTSDLKFQIITWIVAANLFIIFRFWGRESIPDYLLLFDSAHNYLLAHLNATITGALTGLAMGLIDFRLRNVFSRKKSFGRTIFLKGVFYLIIIFLVISVTFLGYGMIKGFPLELSFWKLMQFYDSRDSLTMILYCIVISFLVSFIKQVSRKFGPGVMLQLFTGKYYNPIQEERIFMFLDLKDSTTYAEKLGHIKYSQLIQDCFHELTDVVSLYKAEIYQYVGDEVVVSWDMKHGLENSNCLRFYFAYKRKTEPQVKILYEEI